MGLRWIWPSLEVHERQQAEPETQHCFIELLLKFNQAYLLLGRKLLVTFLASLPPGLGVAIVGIRVALGVLFVFVTMVKPSSSLLIYSLSNRFLAEAVLAIARNMCAKSAAAAAAVGKNVQLFCRLKCFWPFGHVLAHHFSTFLASRGELLIIPRHYTALISNWFISNSFISNSYYT